LFLFIVLCTGCKQNKVTTSDEIYCLGAELYSKEVNGLIITGGIDFSNLVMEGISRKNIKKYGFVYTYYYPEEIDPLVVGGKEMQTIEFDDVEEYNRINAILDIEEENYNKDISFRMYILYTNNKGKDIYVYSNTYNAANLYELALKNNSEYANSIVQAVENRK